MKNYEKLLFVMLVITVITTILSVSVYAFTATIYIDNVAVEVETDGKWYWEDFVYNFDNEAFTYDMETDSVRYNGKILYHLDGTVVSGGDIIDPLAIEHHYITTDSSYCDGSSCPATDSDSDNICDDCGLALAYNLRNDVYNYNGSYFPILPSYDSATYKYAFIYHNTTSNETVLHLSSAPIYVDGSAVLLSDKGSRLAYTLENNEWAFIAEYEFGANTTIISNKSYLIWSSHDVYNGSDELIMSGDPNFRFPLWMEMGQVTQGEMKGLTQTTVGTMKILVVCGVGLMACLVVLSLFGKRSLIFRN